MYSNPKKGLTYSIGTPRNCSRPSPSRSSPNLTVFSVALSVNHPTAHMARPSLTPISSRAMSTMYPIHSICWPPFTFFQDNGSSRIMMDNRKISKPRSGYSIRPVSLPSSE